jgi:hypothetical protein
VAQRLAFHIDCAHQRVLGQDRRVLAAGAVPQDAGAVFSS